MNNNTELLVNTIISTGLNNKVKGFFKSMKIFKLARKSNINKASGINVNKIFYEIFLAPFFNEGLSGLWKNSYIPSEFKGTGKDTFYRFLSNYSYNWRRLINLLALKAIKLFGSLSSRQEKVLILDDTTLPKSGKHIELVSWVFDSVTKKSSLGFKNIVLGWFDGISFIPIDFTLNASSKKANDLVKTIDGRTIGARRRQDASKKKTDMALEMIAKAQNSGIDASFVVFDSWFAFPVFIEAIYDIGYNVVCRLKHLPNIQYKHQGRTYTLTSLYKMVSNSMKYSPTIKGRYASIRVSTKNGLEVKIVFCRRENGNEWGAVLSTDIDLSSEEILRMYAKRWAIEPFFKECKQHLNLGKEQCRNFAEI